MNEIIDNGIAVVMTPPRVPDISVPISTGVKVLTAMVCANLTAILEERDHPDSGIMAEESTQVDGIHKATVKFVSHIDPQKDVTTFTEASLKQATDQIARVLRLRQVRHFVELPLPVGVDDAARMTNRVVSVRIVRAFDMERDAFIVRIDVGWRVLDQLKDALDD